MAKGQVLTWDGSQWTNLYIPQITSISGGGGGNGGSGDGIPEAPQDGNFYVRSNGQWINLTDALLSVGGREFDGGNFTTNQTDAVDSLDADGGNFSA